MKKHHSILFLFGGAILLSACGNRGVLEPPKGKTLPPPAYGESPSPSAEEILTPSTQAQPERSDELLRRSEKRQDDKFDLPPPGQNQP